MIPAEFSPLMGGCGGVYFLAEPGPLVVEVLKRDRNERAATTELRAILAGPDRRVLREAFIPDDGRAVGSGLGPPQAARLTAEVNRAGIYALNITVSADRYGENMFWAFRSSCPRYVVETARGHRDERHQEPIVLESPDMPGVVCFQPRPAAFTIEIEGQVEDPRRAEVYDAGGQLLATLEPDEDGIASWTAPAGDRGDASPWELRLPRARATIRIDGLTRWEPGEPGENMCVWSPAPGSWFPLVANRWPLTPYRQTVHGEPGTPGEVFFRAHNNARQERIFTIAAEFPSVAWAVEAAPSRLFLAPGEAVPVAVRYSVPAGEGPHLCHVRVTPIDAPAISTYSTLIVRPGEAPADGPLDMPIRLRAYEHENEQFGYLPDFPTEYQVYFDLRNRPVMRSGNGIAAWRDGTWTETAMSEAVTSRHGLPEEDAVGLTSTKIAFDAEGGMYLPAVCAGKNVLLHSRDGGRTFAAWAVPGERGHVDIEQFSGHNVPEGPPPFVRFRRTARDPNLIWRSLNDLELFVPRRIEGRIEIGDPVLITRQCIGFSGHSGMPSAVVSRGGRVHVAWGEATDPAETVPGVPTFVATCDRATGGMSPPALIGYGPPANDGHNSPSITMDADGYLHVLIGTHGRPFQYARSLKPDDAGSGWTEPETAGADLRQTYIGFVCAPDGTLHVVFRLWRSGEPFPNSHHATLACQRKRPGQPWEPPRILVSAPFSEYSIFYHRLTIDRIGRLFISYDAWSTHWFYRNDHVGHRRAMLMSPDGGETWKLAETRDLAGVGIR